MNAFNEIVRDNGMRFAQLVTAYSEAQRHYHNLDHLAHLLHVVEPFKDSLDSASWTELVLAVYYHDVVYDSRRSDNEERSAEFAREALTGLSLPNGTHDAVSELILSTKDHRPRRPQRHHALLLDADLAILGESPPRYAAYAEAIRREYAWVPEEAYREGRAKVLERFLQRERIYLTDELHARYEAAARGNLQGELIHEGHDSFIHEGHEGAPRKTGRRGDRE